MRFLGSSNGAFRSYRGCFRGGALGDGEVGVSSVVLLPYAPSSVAVARQRLSNDLQDCGVFDPAIDDAVLVVSELLSNALRHAHPLPSGMVRVSWLRNDGHIEVAVSDGGAATEPRAGLAGPVLAGRPRAGDRRVCGGELGRAA
ncbi:ATP-binding protein [Nonomuraea ferruginea]